MDLSRQFRLIAAAALCALLANGVHADDCISPVPLDEKPAMNAYGDYSDFLVAAMEHKAQEEKKRKHQKMCPELYREAPLTGPRAETLDAAVRETSARPAFDYNRNQSWYNRTTSQSFGLPGLPNSSMAGEAINTSLISLQDGPIEERLHSILLALQSPLSGIEDGANASSLIDRQFTDVLLKRENEILQAFLFDTFGGKLRTISYAPDGSLAVYVGDEGILFIQGNIHVESCLSSCGEFGLTLNLQ